MQPTVLIVDDSALIRSQVRRCLTPVGFRVVEAIDGFDALEKLESEKAICLVVTDVHMPRMGGLDLLERIRWVEELVDLPVLLLTTETERAFVDRAKRLGSKGWLLKPFKPELLISAVKKLTALPPASGVHAVGSEQVPAAPHEDTGS